MSEPAGQPNEPKQDWRDARRAERHARREERREARWGQGGAWVGGLILIILGVLFLLQNYGFPVPRNWWAIFLLLPAAGALGTAWNLYQREGGLTPAIISTALGGVVLAVLGISFLAGFDWGRLWPLILIVLGIGLLVGRMPRN